MYWTRVRILVLLIGSMCSIAEAQDIGLDEYLSKLQSSHPFFAMESLSQDIEREQQRRFLGEQDWMVTASTRYSHEEHSQGNPFVAEKSDRLILSTGMERQFWSNGGRVSISYDYNRNDQLYAAPTGAFDQHTNGLSIAYRLPLMKNKGGILSRLNYELKSYDINIVHLNSLENQEVFLQEQGELFLDWAFLNEQRRIAEKRLDLAREELKQASRKRRVHLIDEVDVLRAKDAVISAEQNLSSIESRWKGLQAELATQSGIEQMNHGQPEFNLYQLKQLPVDEEVVASLRNHSRLLKAIDIRIKQLAHQKSAFRDEMKPELNLVLSGGVGSEDTQFRQSARFDQSQYTAGLEFRQPFGQRTAKSDVARVRIQQLQLQREHSSIARQLEASLRNLLVQLRELDKVMAYNREQIKISRRKTVAELKKYNQGKNELTFVIQSRDNEQQVQLIHAQNATLYQKLYLRYASLNDQLLTKITNENREYQQ